MAFSASDPGFKEFERHGVPQLEQQPAIGERRAYGIYNPERDVVVFASEYTKLLQKTVGEGRRLQGDLFKRELLGEEEPRSAWDIICVVVDKDLNVRIEETDGIVSKNSPQPYLRQLARQISDYVEHQGRLKESSGPARVGLGLEVSPHDLNRTFSCREAVFEKGDLVVVPDDHGEFLWGHVMARGEDGETYVIDLGQMGERITKAEQLGRRGDRDLSEYAERLMNTPATAFDLAKARVHPEHTFQKGELVVVRRNDGSFRYAQVFGESPTVESYLVVVTETRDWKDMPIREIGKLVDPIPQASALLNRIDE